jgi:hypothetical protein
MKMSSDIMSIINKIRQKKFIFNLLLIIFMEGAIQISGCSRSSVLKQGSKLVEEALRIKKARDIEKISKLDISNIRNLENVLEGIAHIPGIKEKAYLIAKNLYSVDFCKEDCGEIIRIILDSGEDLRKIVFHKDFVVGEIKESGFTKKYLKPITKIGNYTLFTEAKITKSFDNKFVKIEEADLLVIARDYSPELLKFSMLPKHELFAILGKLKPQTISPLVKEASEIAAEKAVKDAIAEGVQRSSIEQLRALASEAADRAAQEKLTNGIEGTSETGVSLSKLLFNKTVDSATNKALKKWIK